MQLLWNIDTTDINASQDALRVNVMVSLFTDRRALDSDELPTGKGTDKRGWWADSYRGRKIGSRLWLLSREKQLQSVMNKAEEYAKEALKWLIDDKLITSFTVSATNPEDCILMLVISITQKDGSTPFQLSFKANLNGV